MVKKTSNPEKEEKQQILKAAYIIHELLIQHAGHEDAGDVNVTLARIYASIGESNMISKLKLSHSSYLELSWMAFAASGNLDDLWASLSSHLNRLNAVGVDLSPMHESLDRIIQVACDNTDIMNGRKLEDFFTRLYLLLGSPPSEKAYESMIVLFYKWIDFESAEKLTKRMKNDGLSCSLNVHHARMNALLKEGEERASVQDAFEEIVNSKYLSPNSETFALLFQSFVKNGEEIDTILSVYVCAFVETFDARDCDLAQPTICRLLVEYFAHYPRPITIASIMMAQSDLQLEKQTRELCRHFLSCIANRLYPLDDQVFESRLLGDQNLKLFDFDLAFTKRHVFAKLAPVEKELIAAARVFYNYPNRTYVQSEYSYFRIQMRDDPKSTHTRYFGLERDFTTDAPEDVPPEEAMRECVPSDLVPPEEVMRELVYSGLHEQAIAFFQRLKSKGDVSVDIYNLALTAMLRTEFQRFMDRNVEMEIMLTPDMRQLLVDLGREHLKYGFQVLPHHRALIWTIWQGSNPDPDTRVKLDMAFLCFTIPKILSKLGSSSAMMAKNLFLE